MVEDLCSLPTLVPSGRPAHAEQDPRCTSKLVTNANQHGGEKEGALCQRVDPVLYCGAHQRAQALSTTPSVQDTYIPFRLDNSVLSHQAVHKTMLQVAHPSTHCRLAPQPQLPNLLHIHTVPNKIKQSCKRATISSQKNAFIVSMYRNVHFSHYLSCNAFVI